MKQTIIAAAFMLLTTSCVVSMNSGKDDNMTSPETIVADLTCMSTEYAVRTLHELSECNVDINADGFRYQRRLALETRPDIKYIFEKTADFRWQVTGYGELVNFTLTLSLDDTYEEWTVQPFTLKYEEGFGYSATLSTQDDVVMYTHRGSILSRVIRQTGTYFLQIFINGKAADSFSITYSAD